MRLLKSVADLEHHLELWREDRKPGLVLLMEGADPILHVRDLKRWWQRGLRMIGLTYGDTRYGSGMGGGSSPHIPGGLTAEGVALLESMAELGFTWDISHLDEPGVWQGLELNYPHVCASHANARALIPTSRHLSDQLIRAVAVRNGLIGLVLYNAFLDPRWRANKSIPVTLDATICGDRRPIWHSSWGTGSISASAPIWTAAWAWSESPQEIDTVADLYQIGSVVPAEAHHRVLSTNWLNFLSRSLPQIRLREIRLP